VGAAPYIDLPFVFSPPDTHVAGPPEAHGGTVGSARRGHEESVRMTSDRGPLSSSPISSPDSSPKITDRAAGRQALLRHIMSPSHASNSGSPHVPHSLSHSTATPAPSPPTHGHGRSKLLKRFDSAEYFVEKETHHRLDICSPSDPCINAPEEEENDLDNFILDDDLGAHATEVIEDDGGPQKSEDKVLEADAHTTDPSNLRAPEDARHPPPSSTSGASSRLSASSTRSNHSLRSDHSPHSSGAKALASHALSPPAKIKRFDSAEYFSGKGPFI